MMQLCQIWDTFKFCCKAVLQRQWCHYSAEVQCWFISIHFSLPKCNPLNIWVPTHTISLLFEHLFLSHASYFWVSAWVSQASGACSQLHVFWLLAFPLAALIGVRYHSCLFKSSPSSLASHWSTAPGLFRLRCVLSRIIARSECLLLRVGLHNQILCG